MKLLGDYLAEIKSLPISEVKTRLADPRQHCISLRGESGSEYQIEIEPLQVSNDGQELELLGSIDDGRLRAFAPLSQTIAIRWDGTAIRDLEAV